MMQVSKQLDYAIQLVDSLTKLKDGELLSLKTFSKESNISFLFLQRIARKLKQENLIKSVRGVRGGYFINKKNIKMKEIVNAVEGGNYVIAECLKNGKICKKRDCPAKKIFAKINKGLDKVLNNIQIGQ